MIASSVVVVNSSDVPTVTSPEILLVTGDTKSACPIFENAAITGSWSLCLLYLPNTELMLMISTLASSFKLFVTIIWSNI